MATTNPTDLRPFEIAIPEGELVDLRERLDRTRWPTAGPDGTGWARGVPIDYLQSLAEYWRTTFDWRDQEAALNRFPQLSTTIDGQPIHLVHVRSPEPEALPLVLLHSWPGSPVEFARLIGPLADPRGHGADPADAFHVVAPSLPGFGFSNPVTEAGWTTGRAARALAELMARLGYDRYGVHGGDIGAGVGSGLTSADPEHVAALHVTSDPATAVSFVSWSGDPAANQSLSEAEKARVEELKRWSKDDEGYLRLQSTRPQTIGYAWSTRPSRSWPGSSRRSRPGPIGRWCSRMKRSTAISC
jgi:pimeloyl-ACP methyl ester carboxylesterase